MPYKNPLISVIVPFYNCEKYIKECVNSIENQTYQNLEIILINDGSKDNSLNIVQKLVDKDKRIKLINQNNSGVSSARNNGIENSHGDYICFIDADDYLENDFIEYLYNLIEENNAEISLTPYPRKFNSKNKEEKKSIKKDYIEIWSGKEIAKQMLYYNIVIAPWNKLISKELISQYDIRFDTSLSFGEGFNYSMDCFQRAKKVVVRT